ncbi:PHD finger protein [Platanthera guangdongensis]|uniref:PHD finger protein n=1 Tax=Platanthera guangdongensis TaxID=2320717 RepID=A0ABR2MLJ9_9ASPA
MGDEATETAASAAQPDAEPQPPPAKKRRGREEDLRRVAEIVMVLSAMVEMRAGKEPTETERALAAEARERLARACEELRPKDLFSSEAVRVVVEDLGLNRSKDPVLAFRPPKMSIAERVLHTKKKMEESRDFASSTHVSQPHSISFTPSSEPHGSHRFITGKSSPMVLSAGGFPNNSSDVHVPAPASSMSSVKQTPISEAHSALVKSSFGKDSPSAACSIEAVNQRLDARINGPTYFTLVRPTVVSNYLPDKASVSGISTSAALAAHSQANNLLVNHEIKVLQASHQMMKIHDTKSSVVQTTQANMAIGNQLSQGLTFVPVTSFTGNHSEIAKSIMSVVQPRVPDCPNLPPPSTEYMSRPLNCQVCKLIITDVESLLVCDACEKGTHLKCLQSHGAKVIPKADWYCQKCLSTSNGKPFPPKYGRVTRQITAVKTTSSGGGTIPLEKNWENPELKFNHQKLAVNENLSSSGVAQTSNMFSRLEEVSRESNLSNRKEFDEAYSNWKKPGEGMNSGISVNNLGENSGFASSTPAAPSGNTDSQAARIKLSEAEALEPFVSDSQSRSSDKQPNQSLSTSEIQTSVCEIMPDIKTQSEFLCSNQKHEIGVEIASQSHFPSDLQVTNEINVPIIAESTENLMQKTSIPITDELEDTSKFSEASTSQVLKVKVEGEHGSELIHDQILENIRDMACCGNSSMEVLHKFDWVGDIIEVLDDRTYYNSCRINGCIIKLQDNVIVSMDNQNFYPAKLLSLWEDNKVSSKLALVNDYCFPGTLPESVMQPSTPMQDEVYASDKISTISASSICRLCIVLPEDKFREETDRKTFSADKADVLNSIFLCKWKFDRTNGIFRCPAQFI